MSKDRPILFSAPMVRALLAGTKTQTGRILNPQPSNVMVQNKSRMLAIYNEEVQLIRHRFAVGDRLYVREAWRAGMARDSIAPRNLRSGSFVVYEADGPHDCAAVHGKFRQAMHMPRWASRLTLIVTDVRVQRLQEISDADAIAEGIERIGYDGPDPSLADIYGWRDYRDHPHAIVPFHSTKPVLSYQSLWDSLNAERDGGAYAWAANPWVVAVSFSAINQNIDQVKP